MSNYIGTKGSEYATLIYGTSTTTLSVMCDYNGTLNTSKYYWFAICIQQWGRDDANNTVVAAIRVDFSITFSAKPSVLATKCTTSLNNHNNIANRINEIQTSYFKIMPDSYNGFSWIAIGIQQWGYYVGSKSKMYVPFHITFQSQCFTVIGCDAAISTTDTGGVDEAVYISDWSLTQFRVSISSDRNTISYIAFGIQQWGLFDSTSTTGTINLPLTMPSADYKPMITMLNSCASCGVKNVTTSSFYYFTRDENGTTKRPAYWLIVGNQQWGLVPHFSGSTNVVYPVAFSTHGHWVAAPRSSSTNDSIWCTGGWGGTLTGFSVATKGTEIEWIAIGYQQWGYNLGTTSTTDTFTFPIAFPTACHTIITSVKWDTNDGYSARPVTAFTKTNFTMFVKRSDFYICWISFGKQQWGYGNGGSSYNHWTFSFPVSYPTKMLSISICGSNNNTTDKGTNYFYNVSNNSISIYSHLFAFVITLGYQAMGLQK